MNIYNKIKVVMNNFFGEHLFEESFFYFFRLLYIPYIYLK